MCDIRRWGRALGTRLKELGGVYEEVEIPLDSMRLKVDAKHDGQTLQFRYTLTNDTAADLFVQHFVSGYPDVETTCYIYHVRPDQVVLWAGTPTRAPSRHAPLRMFACPPTPWAQRLSPGESLDVLLHRVLPLVEHGLWNDGEGTPEPVWANMIRFRLDVQPMRRGLKISEHRGQYWVHGHHPVVLKASTPIDPPIPVRRYGEEFHRAGLED